jgi:alpha-ketoglutarate-dependent taurine dioxygenase
MPAQQQKQAPAGIATDALPAHGFVCRPLSSALGAEVTGSDLARLADGELDAIKALFLKHHLLVLREQHLTDADIQRFAEAFGPIEVNQVKGSDGAVLQAVHAIANVDSQGRPAASPLLKANYNWHSDKSYLPQPSLMTMLYGLEVPPVGGDTQFANMEQAYADLPAETKARIAGLVVVQSFEYMLDKLGQRAIIDAAMIPPPVEHPLVRTHPETGRKSLFVGMYSSRIVGMAQAEAEQLVADLLAHATQEKYTFTQQWRTHDFVVWDNRSLIHRAIPNYDMGAHRRILRRCVVRGGVPQ